MADPGSVNGGNGLGVPVVSFEGPDSPPSTPRPSRTVRFTEPTQGRDRSVTRVQHDSTLTESFSRRRQTEVWGAHSPDVRRRNIQTAGTPVATRRQPPAAVNAAANVRRVPVKVTVESIRNSFGGLIERTAGGAQKVSEGYDRTIRAHFDNIRTTLKDPDFHGDRGAITEYLNYLEDLLPPRNSDEAHNSKEILPNGKLVSPENKDVWLQSYADPVARLKTDWAIVAGQIGSLQNASNRDQAINQIRGQLAFLENERLGLTLPQATRVEADGEEFVNAMADLRSYQAYLQTALEDKIAAIDEWEAQAGPEATAAFRAATLAINELPGKPDSRRAALLAIREAISKVPQAVQQPKTKEFLQAQERFFAREAKIIDIWKATTGHTDRTRSRADFLEARKHLHQHTYAFADRIEARNKYIEGLLDNFNKLSKNQRAETAHHIRGVLTLNKDEYDNALKAVSNVAKLNKTVARSIFGDFAIRQASLANALKQAEAAPIAPPPNKPANPAQPE